MSYILDALRRADAERERGAVPSLQSQQHTIAEDDAGTPARSRWLVWAVVGLSVALVAVVAWNLLGSRGATPARPVAEGSVAPAQGVLLPTSPAPAPQPQTPAAATAALAAPPTPPVADAEPAKPPPAAARTHARAPAKEDAKRTGAHPRGDGARAESARAESARDERPKDRATGETRVYKQSELPEEIRRDLPKLAIGGASYSGDAASRMVMINGQVFHEGDPLGPNLVLERIKLKSAVLSYKGYRYEVTF